VSFAASQVWGLEHTSLIHAYLCVSTTPIIIAGGTWILRRPISWGELGGTLLGAGGTVLLTLGPGAKGGEVCFRCFIFTALSFTDSTEAFLHTRPNWDRNVSLHKLNSVICSTSSFVSRVSAEISGNVS